MTENNTFFYNESYNTGSGSDTYGLFLIFLAAANTPLCVIGIIGNLISLYVLVRRTLPRSSMFFFLKALNICDIVVLISSATFILSICFIQNHFISFDAGFGYVKWMNLYVMSSLLYYASTGASTMLVMLISLERWLAVCKSMIVHHICTPHRVKCATAASIVLSILLLSPRISEVQLTHVNNASANDSDGESIILGLTFSYQGHSAVYIIGYRIVLYALVSFVAPLILIIYCNFCLIRVIRLASRQSLHLSLEINAMRKPMNRRPEPIEHSRGFLQQILELFRRMVNSKRDKQRDLQMPSTACISENPSSHSGANLIRFGSQRAHSRSSYIYQIAEHKVAVVGVCIVIVFCLSAVPSLIIELYESSELLMKAAYVHEASAIRHYLPMVSKLLMTINCSANVIIYCLCTEQFRNLLKGKGARQGAYRCSWRASQPNSNPIINTASVSEQEGHVRFSIMRTETTGAPSDLLP